MLSSVALLHPKRMMKRRVCVCVYRGRECVGKSGRLRAPTRLVVVRGAGEGEPKKQRRATSRSPRLSLFAPPLLFVFPATRVGWVGWGEKQLPGSVISTARASDGARARSCECVRARARWRRLIWRSRGKKTRPSKKKLSFFKWPWAAGGTRPRPSRGRARTAPASPARAA